MLNASAATPTLKIHGDPDVRPQLAAAGGSSEASRSCHGAILGPSMVGMLIARCPLSVPSPITGRYLVAMAMLLGQGSCDFFLGGGGNLGSSTRKVKKKVIS